MATELTIGEFARRAGLSAKALRLYDERGFLRPIRVDASSGYRYYDVGQLARARAVALLRRLDLPLADIANLLALPPESTESHLRQWWNARRRSFDDRHGALELVIHALATPEPDRAIPAPMERFEPGAVDVISLPPGTVAVIRRDVTQAELVATFLSDVVEIRRHLAESGAQVDHGYWVEYHSAVGPNIVGSIETCVPYVGTAAPADDIVLRAEPARRGAAIELTAADCAYPRIMAVYAALNTWVDAHATASGSVRERYTGKWCDDGVVGQLIWPIGSG